MRILTFDWLLLVAREDVYPCSLQLLLQWAGPTRTSPSCVPMLPAGAVSMRTVVRISTATCARCAACRCSTPRTPSRGERTRRCACSWRFSDLFAFISVSAHRCAAAVNDLVSVCRCVCWPSRPTWRRRLRPSSAMTRLV